MIKLKQLLNEKKFRMPSGSKVAMKLFTSKTFEKFTKDRYDIDITNPNEKNKSGINYMIRDIKDDSIMSGLVL